MTKQLIRNKGTEVTGPHSHLLAIVRTRKMTCMDTSQEAQPLQKHGAWYSGRTKESEGKRERYRRTASKSGQASDFAASQTASEDGKTRKGLAERPAVVSQRSLEVNVT